MWGCLSLFLTQLLASRRLFILQVSAEKLCCQSYWPLKTIRYIWPATWSFLTKCYNVLTVMVLRLVITHQISFQSAGSVIWGTWFYMLVLHLPQQVCSLPSKNITLTWRERVLNWQSQSMKRKVAFLYDITWYCMLCYTFCEQSLYIQLYSKCKCFGITAV